MTRTEKEQFIADLRERFTKAEVALTVAFRGLDVTMATNLRKKMRDGGVDYRVVKNTLAKIATEGTDKEPLADQFTGPTAVILSYDDVVAPAKILYGFLTKETQDKITVKHGVVQGRKISPAEVEALSKMPGLPELRAQLLAMINTPATMLARLVNTPGQQIAQVIKANSEKEAA